MCARIAVTSLVYMNNKWLVAFFNYVFWLIRLMPIARSYTLLLEILTMLKELILTLSAFETGHALSKNSIVSAKVTSTQKYGGGRATFSGAMLKSYVIKPEDCNIGLSSRYSFEFQCRHDELGSVLDRNPACIAAEVPLKLIFQRLTRQELIQISKLHSIWVPTRLSVANCKALFVNHSCENCSRLFTIFKCIESISDENAASQPTKASGKFVYTSRARQNKYLTDIASFVQKLRLRRKSLKGSLDNTEFPPRILSFRETHKLISKMCMGMEPTKFLESGCAVCGCLTPLSELGPLQLLTPYLNLLNVKGVTRKERLSMDDPVEDLPGPILASRCNKVCVECETALVNCKMPKKALALHNWLGDVPTALQGLSYAESIMIAKVRHNRCVVRVTSGRMRMSANAIMFSQPVLKVYHKLPPSREEMHQILAFIFTGSAQPTQEDFDRTPMLVRRSKVLAALEWLKLNHEAYAELEISLENLNSYAERDIPVVVEFRRTDPKDLNAASIFPVPLPGEPEDTEYGTETGECLFSVHGLTGEEYASATMSTLKVVALEHITRNGGILGIGRSEKPVSMYDSVSTYPSMFPWLFPYGKGGIGHPKHRFKQGEGFRKKCLLMYYDKRFQLDPYFPMIAFNHEQLKAASTGSKLLADRSKFNAVKARLNAVNPEVAGNIADRFAAGEYVKPVTDAEKLCFDVVKD
jgi:hypothetical protein